MHDTRAELSRIDAWWRAANYLSVGQIYLMDNPLLREELLADHVKPRLLGHWGTTPGLNFIYAHLSRAISARELNMMYIIGPGHGGPGLVASAWLEGTYNEVYPGIGQDADGMRRLFWQFSFPGGIPSHVAPETPGSIHEGGELGYSLSHAYGAAFDNPDLVVAAIVGDGEAETGPLATSWHSNKFIDPSRDGAVLPILHLNGYRIANPTVLARIGEDELTSLMRGYGHTPYIVEGSDPAEMHQAFAACYEAFIHLIDSMFNQHAKWLKVTDDIPWRRPIASLNYLLTSHVWRQDHNGLSHQDPGFIDHVMNKKASVVRVYLPADANTLLSVADHCLRSKQYVNVIVAGKQPAPQYLSMDEAVVHATKGVGIWDWASTDRGQEPDVVIGCAGDVSTMEALAAVGLLHGFFPDLKIRFVNVVNLMRLQDEREHPHGLSEAEFDALFTRDKPVIFAYHGYPWLIHRLTYRRTNHANFHVHGYKEEGTTTTPFDMTVMNRLDRFNLAINVIDRVPRLQASSGAAREQLKNRLIEHKIYVRSHGEDMEEIQNWSWMPAHGPEGTPDDPTLDDPEG